MEQPRVEGGVSRESWQPTQRVRWSGHHSWVFWAILVICLSSSDELWADSGQTKNDTVAARNPLESAWQRIHKRVRELVESKKLVPPVPVVLSFSPRKIWSGELPEPAIALRGVDLGRDGQSELLLLTTHELLVIRRHRGLFDVRLRKVLPDHAPAIRPRDPIGAIAFRVGPEGEQELRVRSSEQSRGSIWRWENEDLHERSIFRGYPACATGIVRLAAGRNFFRRSNSEWRIAEELDLLSEMFWSVDCASYPSPSGRRAQYFSRVDVDGVFRLRCTGDDHCTKVDRELEGVGYAYEVVDLDSDGYPEIVASSNSLLPSKERLTVYSTKGGGTKILFEKNFPTGVLGVASGDFDGDGAREAVVLGRGLKPNAVELWLLN